jgi:peptide subunit release factor 1 (eRF1)
MATIVSWERLRELAEFRAEKGLAVSVYMGLDPSVAPTAGAAATRFKSLLDEGDRRAAADTNDLSHEQREALKADFERIRRYFDEEFSRDGAQGLVVFSAGLDNYWSALALTDAPPDDVKVGTRFYLAPLVSLVGKGEGALVAFVTRERGDLYRLRRGRLDEVASRSEDLPRRHDQGGWSQARLQRRIDGQAANHVREVVEELNRQTRRLHGPPVVVVATEEMQAEVEDLLTQETRAALAGRAQAEAHASPPELLDVVTPVLEEWRAQREEQLIERWREELGRSGRAATGWGETLEAASDGRVELLLFEEGANREAWQCPACGRAATTSGNCPLDGTRMEQRTEGLDLAVHQTLAHGGTVWAIRNGADLGSAEGIAALLRY